MWNIPENPVVLKKKISKKKKKPPPGARLGEARNQVESKEAVPAETSSTILTYI